jgi:type VI secretion system protein ImpI
MSPVQLTLTVTGAQAATLGESAHIVFTNCGGTIGRDESCDWVLPHPLVSRLHAIVRYANGVFTIEDRSTNGTRRVADATRLAAGVPEAIHDGDVLVIGPYTVTVRVEAEVVAGEIAAPDDDSSDSSSTRIPAADTRTRSS